MGKKTIIKVEKTIIHLNTMGVSSKERREACKMREVQQ
jgi:hypothetical protein